MLPHEQASGVCAVARFAGVVHSLHAADVVFLAARREARVGSGAFATMVIAFRTAQLSEPGAAPPSDWQSAELGELLFARLGAFHGVLPPLGVLNETLLLGSCVDNRNLAYFWEPFELEASAYARLRSDVLDHSEWSGEIDESGPPAEPEWGHWAFVRSLRKLRRDGIER